MNKPKILKAKTIKSKMYLIEAVLWLVILLVASTGIAFSQESMGDFRYPEVKTVDSFVTWHGRHIPDPYRWLENIDDPDRAEFIEAENKLFNEFVAGPRREAYAKRYEARFNYAKFGIPETRGGKIFYTENDGLKNQALFYIQDGPEKEARVLMDPNLLSDDGTLAVSMHDFSPDGSLMAYCLSQSGSDWQVLKIKSVSDDKTYSDSLQWLKLDNVAWLDDNSGFFYDRYPEPIDVKPGEDTFYDKVYFHKLGTPQSADVLVYEDNDNPSLGYSVSTYKGCDKLFLRVWKGSDDYNGVSYRRLDSDGDFVRLLAPGEAEYDILNCNGDTLFIKTSYDAPNMRIIAIDLANPDRANWKDIIPEKDMAIDQAIMVNDHFAVTYLKDASSVLDIFDRTGSLVSRPELPALGAIVGSEALPDDKEFYFGFYSFLYPYSIYKYDFGAGELSLFRKPNVDFDPADFVTEEVFYESKDGTKVPLFITHRKDMALDGDNPTILYGYGGFGVNQTPYFSASKSLWLEYGGILAVAPIRGGSEYGEDWHLAAIREKRQNAFDDFIAASEWLIDNGYTSRKKLAIEGGSNGGLLVAACMIQRPELFGAVLCEVPLTDMLRYHLMGVGYWWVSEFGNAEESAEDFDFLLKYSPYHNIKKGVTYPPTLISTAESDNRVVPAHSLKFAAALQAADSGKNPILLRVEPKAGHGSGKPTYKIINEIADTYAFLFRVFDMDLK